MWGGGAVTKVSPLFCALLNVFIISRVRDGFISDLVSNKLGSLFWSVRMIGPTAGRDGQTDGRTTLKHNVMLVHAGEGHYIYFRALCDNLFAFPNPTDKAKNCTYLYIIDTLLLLTICTAPDSITLVGQRWANGTCTDGPTVAATGGPLWACPPRLCWPTGG